MLRLFGFFDVVHTCTSHTDRLWTGERIVKTRAEVETALEELKAELEAESLANPEIAQWTDKGINTEHDNYGIFYREWKPIHPTREETNGNDPELWSSRGVLRIVRPAEVIRKLMTEDM